MPYSYILNTDLRVASYFLELNFLVKLLPRPGLFFESLFLTFKRGFLDFFSGCVGVFNILFLNSLF